MKRLYILVEGQTEEAFVKEVLSPHLGTLGEWNVGVYPVIVGTKRLSSGEKFRGGGQWSKWKRDLHNLCSTHQGHNVRFTTIFDLYGLPEDFPSLDAHEKVSNTLERAKLLEDEIARAIEGEWRLIPYVQRHEFEALVLACLPALESMIQSAGKHPGIATLEALVRTTPPEDINDSKSTAPSKRLQSALPSYSKLIHGPAAIETTGLQEVREQCPRFDQWLSKLEEFAQSK